MKTWKVYWRALSPNANPASSSFVPGKGPKSWLAEYFPVCAVPPLPVGWSQVGISLRIGRQPIAFLKGQYGYCRDFRRHSQTGCRIGRLGTAVCFCPHGWHAVTQKREKRVRCPMAQRCTWATFPDQSGLGIRIHSAFTVLFFQDGSRAGLSYSCGSPSLSQGKKAW